MSVIVQPKSEWQKDDCLLCGDTAELEAVLENVFIRCCTKDACQEGAKKWAEESAESISAIIRKFS